MASLHTYLHFNGNTDIDGHLWEVFHTDESKRPESPNAVPKK